MRSSAILVKKRISVLVTPRDPNPYQELLYKGVRDAGVRVRYASGPTSSQSVNALLAPALLIWYRVQGFRILHIHWTFQFDLPWAGQRGWVRRLMQWWFRFYLALGVFFGYKIIWTAHDLLPYPQIFNDDSRAREALISNSRAIVALSESSANELRSLGAKRVHVIPFGSYVEPYPLTISKEEARASLGFEPDDLVAILMGRIEPYKGADLLLEAVGRLPLTSRIKTMIVGACNDDAYRSELVDLAGHTAWRAKLNLEWVPEDELGLYLQASDIAVFPFRVITNSSSIVLAASFGLPVVISDLPMLRDIPESAAIRYTPTNEVETDSLLSALDQVERLSTEEYLKMCTAASEWAHRNDWSSVARQTTEVYKLVLSSEAKSE